MSDLLLRFEPLGNDKEVRVYAVANGEPLTCTGVFDGPHFEMSTVWGICPALCASLALLLMCCFCVLPLFPSSTVCLSPLSARELTHHSLILTHSLTHSLSLSLSHSACALL
jgi:hypothetical protein